MPTVRTHQWETYFQSALMMLQPEGKRLSLNKRAWGGRRRRKGLLWAISKVWGFILEAMKSYGRLLWQEVRWSICNLERSSVSRPEKECGEGQEWLLGGQQWEDCSCAGERWWGLQQVQCPEIERSGSTYGGIDYGVNHRGHSAHVSSPLEILAKPRYMTPSEPIHQREGAILLKTYCFGDHLGSLVS